MISICASCYNHAPYIPFFMETLLKQDFRDWELIVTDDCSTDGSYEALQSYSSDPRVHVYRTDCNRHVCQTSNHSYTKARGKYVCIFSTDDAFAEGKLAHDVDYLEKHPEISVLYDNMCIIGEDNTAAKDAKKNWKHRTDYDQYQFLHRLFTRGNCMMIPGMVVRKSCMDAIGLLNPLLQLTQDYEYHIRLMLNYEIAISDAALTYYRRRDNEQNLSAGTPENENHSDNEVMLLLSGCVQQIKGVSQFRRIFPEFDRYSDLTDADIPFYAGLQLVESKSTAIRSAGLRILYDFVSSNTAYVESKYGFYAKDFMAIARRVQCSFRDQLVSRGQITRPLDRLIYTIWASMRRKLRRRGII